MGIKENYQKLRKEIPDSVVIIAACKGRTKEEIEEVIEAGAEHLGENYVQEAERMHEALGENGKDLRWHMIGHLQKNKINKALQVFDVIQTIDREEIAVALNERAQRVGKVVPVYIEINIASEMTKSGVKADYGIIEGLVCKISQLKYLHLEGLMTMEPQVEDSEDSKPYFKKTKDIFDRIKSLNLPNVDMKYLSMGISDSYKIAIEEGSNMVRLGTVIFGER